MESIFDSVKDAVTVPEAAREYGFKPNRAGFICCPFHSEKTPSMKLYERTFHCYGCGAHGTAIDLVSRLFDLNPLDAAKKLNEDFHLHLSVEPPDRDERENHRKRIEVQRLFDGWKDTTLNQIDAAIRVANRADYANPTGAEATAIIFKEALEYWADILLNEPLSEQMAVFCDRGEVGQLCRKILQPTLTRSNTA